MTRRRSCAVKQGNHRYARVVQSLRRIRWASRRKPVRRGFPTGKAVITSSNINRMSCLSQISRSRSSSPRAAIHAGELKWGSTMNAAMVEHMQCDQRSNSLARCVPTAADARERLCSISACAADVHAGAWMSENLRCSPCRDGMPRIPHVITFSRR